RRARHPGDDRGDGAGRGAPAAAAARRGGALGGPARAGAGGHGRDHPRALRAPRRAALLARRLGGGWRRGDRPRSWRGPRSAPRADALREAARSGREALDQPGAGGLARVAEAVVQAVGAALPELEGVGLDAEAAPGGRTDQLAIGVALEQLTHPPLQHLAAGNDRALARGGGAQPALERAAGEV